ncbi:WXG100 family type VII secretion target [Nocardioides hwasunensis]|uniref:TrbL/VirB6 plasmid conjugal transfer protein n=1 Tax=Nocardioides hwasunensis TaxID=397258 RepID=A0ABR8MHY9_9ACTN|nr:hypothetical protein [Nocardioides hwasunensis]MBD3915543.1 hypothetical protein [Nocardioides hwasunensis]
MGAMGGVDQMAQAGFMMTVAATPLIPVGWACAGSMLPMIGDPDALLEAGMAWLDAAQEIQDGLTANMDLTNSLGSSWQGADYDAFTEKAADLSRQLMVTMALAYAVGVALILAAIAVMIACIIVFVIGLGFALWSAAILFAMATVVGNLGPVEVLMFDANIWALQAESSLMSVNSGLSTTFNVLAGTVTAALAADVGLQIAFGNEEALGDLAQATVLSVPTITAGLASVFFRDSVALGMKPPFSSGIVRGLGVLMGTGVVDPVGDVTEQADPTRG